MPEITIKGIPAITLAFATAIIVTWYFLPRIINVVKKFNLMDKPVLHKIHNGEIPTLGGIGIFAGFTTGFLVSVDGYIPGISYFAAASMLLFFLGITDDLLYLQPKKKLMAEIVSVLLIVLFTELRFTSLHGFLGISTIPAWASYSITIFLVIVIINAVNLTDGIDGLASSVGIIGAATFGTWFFLAGDYGYAILAAALIGSLAVFFRFNIAKRPNKIFMGDSGSLVIGFSLAVFAIHFNELNLTDKPISHLNSSPSVSIAILIIPLFDTIRVVVLRLLNHQHPFVADHRHLHHIMLRAGFTHIESTIIISVFNIFIIAVAFLFDSLGILYLGLLLLTLCMVFTGIVLWLAKRYRNLEIYRMANDLNSRIDSAAEDLPDPDLKVEYLTIKSASKNIEEAIVEGYGKRIRKPDYIHFLNNALDSCRETSDHISELKKRHQELNGIEELEPSFDVLQDKIKEHLQDVKSTSGRKSYINSVLFFPKAMGRRIRNRSKV
jgi:four helix bundle protein